MNIFVPKGHQKDPTKNASIWTGGITDFPCKSLIEPYWSHYFANPRQVSVEQALQQRENHGKRNSWNKISHGHKTSVNEMLTLDLDKKLFSPEFLPSATKKHLWSARMVRDFGRKHFVITAQPLWLKSWELCILFYSPAIVIYVCAKRNQHATKTIKKRDTIPFELTRATGTCLTHVIKKH